MSKRISARVGFLPMLALVLVAQSEVGRGQERALTTDELARRSDVVVVGKVSSMSSEWNNDKSRIFTRVTVSVDQYIKGDSGEHYVTVTTPGGEVDGVGELYSHSVRFVNDEEVVLFAVKDRQGGLRVAGGDQGKYTVKKSEETGRPMVSNDRTLEEFVTHIKTVIKAQNER